MILNAFFAAIGQLTDPRFRRVFWLGIALTMALLIGVSAGFVWLLGSMIGDQVNVWLIGEVRWLNDLVSWGSGVLLIVLSVFLMIPVASAITSMFLDHVAQAVEDKHYPHLPVPTPVPFGDALRDTVNFLGVLVAANIGALILYLFLAPATPIIFWGLNGFLLGREYFMMAAMRRVGREQAKVMRARHMPTIWMAGVLMAVPLSIPLLNLFIPIIGAATFTHLFHMLGSLDQKSPDH